jgi:hypothetical protein
MDSEMRSDGASKHAHGHHHGAHSYWASWCSPVGLGIFLVAAMLALHLLLHAVGMFMSEGMSMEKHDMRGGYTASMPMSGSAGMVMPQ